MFRVHRPSAAAIQQCIAAASHLQPASPRLLDIEQGLIAKPPFGYFHDRTRTRIGIGEEAFQIAIRAFLAWRMFGLGWVRVANPAAKIELGQVVCVEAHTLGLWTLNLSRITQVVDEPTRFGFVYSTTAQHVELGEERFLLTFNPRTGEVFYDLEAVSRPASWMAYVGLPITRHFQRKFARKSHRMMADSVPQLSDNFPD